MELNVVVAFNLGVHLHIGPRQALAFRISHFHHSLCLTELYQQLQYKTAQSLVYINGIQWVFKRGRLLTDRAADARRHVGNQLRHAIHRHLNQQVALG